jgi:hypothetical protein
LKHREDLRGIGEVDEIKKCAAVLSPLFIGRGEHGGCDTTTMMAERWRRLEGGLAKIFSLPRINSDAREIGRGFEMV